MPIMESTRSLKTWKGDYSFATDGGAVSTITLRSNDGPIPSGSRVLGGYIEVDTAPTSAGAATISVGVEAAGDLQAAAAISGAPWSTLGHKDVIPDATGSTAVELTAARDPSIAIATAALTAGVFNVVLFYR